MIRPLKKSDKDQILALDKIIFGTMDDGWTSDDFDYFFNGDLCFVSYEEGNPEKINGYIFANQNLNCTYISNIGVVKEFQGMGIGKELMKMVMLKELEHPAERSYSTKLQVLSTNQRALTFYQRLGFQVTSFEEPWVQMEATTLPGLFHDVSLSVDRQDQTTLYKESPFSQEERDALTQAFEKIVTNKQFLTFFATSQQLSENEKEKSSQLQGDKKDNAPF